MRQIIKKSAFFYDLQITGNQYGGGHKLLCLQNNVQI